MKQFNDVIPLSLEDYYRLFDKKHTLNDITNNKSFLFIQLKLSDYKSIIVDSIEYFILYSGLSVLKHEWYYVDLISKHVDGFIKVERQIIVQNGIPMNGLDIKLKTRETIEKLNLLKQFV
jgi:hypothetical protein